VPVADEDRVGGEEAAREIARVKEHAELFDLDGRLDASERAAADAIGAHLEPDHHPASPSGASSRGRPKMREPGGTERVSQTFPPMTLPAPITVSPPWTEAPA